MLGRGHAYRSTTITRASQLGLAGGAPRWMQVRANARGKCSILLSIEWQHASDRFRQECQLLLAVRDPGWQRDNMPVDVPVALLTSQTHHVQTFSRKGASDRFANPIHPALQN